MKLSDELVEMLNELNMSTRQDIEDHVVKFSTIARKLERQLETEQLNNKALQTECDELATEVQRMQEVTSQVEDYAMEQTEKLHIMTSWKNEMRMKFYQQVCLLDSLNWWQRLFKVGF